MAHLSNPCTSYSLAANLDTGLVYQTDPYGGTSSTPTPTPVTPQTITFTIPLGTNGSDWNTQGSMITLNIGDTLHIVNNDSVPHVLHTGPGAPCPHQPPLSSMPYDCTVTSSWDPTVSGPFYDHYWGDSPSGAKFWVKVN